MFPSSEPFPTCTYCGKAGRSPADTFRAITGWETVDQRTDLKWIGLPVFACASCVAEHFLGGAIGARLGCPRSRASSHVLAETAPSVVIGSR
jgi:hypothetical protein